MIALLLVNNYRHGILHLAHIWSFFVEFIIVIHSFNSFFILSAIDCRMISFALSYDMKMNFDPKM